MPSSKVVLCSDQQPYVWVAYQGKSPYLPIAVADTTRELGQILGKSRNSIESYVSKYKKGRINTKQPRYMCVYLDEED